VTDHADDEGVGVVTVDYERYGRTYAQHRRPDPRIAARIHAALGGARTVLNVGAGTGSYEPSDRWVLAVEPSATMRAQRPAEATPAIAASAESLPLDDDAVDAAMACVTIHHWSPRAAGLAELRRVARGPVVIFTFELEAMPEWQRDLFGSTWELECRRFGTTAEVAAELGGDVRVETIPTPADCVDGFVEAFWNRPEALLDPEVRAAQSLWALFEPGVEDRIVADLRAQLESGEWDRRYGDLRERDSYDGSLRLVISAA
jgi:SAM-dependent methyltransferase